MFRLGLRLARCHAFWTQNPNLKNDRYGILVDAMVNPFAEDDSMEMLDKTNKKLLNAILVEDPAQKYGEMVDRLKAAEATSKGDREQRNASEKTAENLARELDKAKADAAAEIDSLKARLAEREERIKRLEDENGWLKTHGGDLDRKWVEEIHDSHGDVAKTLRSAETILREQEERNLRYGTLKTLRHDAEQLKEMEERLHEAMRLSLSLHPQMNDIYRQVKAARRKIGERLAGTPEGDGLIKESPVVLQIRTDIRSVSPASNFHSALNNIHAFLRDKCMETLLTHQEISSLCDECNRREEVLQKAIDTYEVAKRQVPEIWNPGERGSELAETTIALDAYNVMLRSPEWQNAINEGKRSFQELRANSSASAVHLAASSRRSGSYLTAPTRRTTRRAVTETSLWHTQEGGRTNTMPTSTFVTCSTADWQTKTPGSSPMTMAYATALKTRSGHSFPVTCYWDWQRKHTTDI